MDINEGRLLSDEAWKALAGAVSAVRPHAGRPARCDRRFLDAVRWMLRTGAPWRDLPRYFGAWQSTYRRFARWSKAGRWQSLWRFLADSSSEAVAENKLLCVDSTSVRVHAHGSPGRASNSQECVGKSRGGRTTKVHLACRVTKSHSWRAEGAILSPGNRHDICAAAKLVDRYVTPKAFFLADKAYDAQWLRNRIGCHGATAIIPSRSGRLPWYKRQAHLYWARNVVERAFGRLKQFRRAASRFDRLAAHFGAFVQVGFALSFLSSSSLPR